ncbi:MAG: RNA methyltransferase [Deltaproteobacteria bacterium]|nr:RNA methyltransferase [Deltaproteobacteria bacterium]
MTDGKQAGRSGGRRRGVVGPGADAPSLRPLDALVVVLVETDGAGNAGSVARLCGNFGVELRLVRPNCALHSREALRMAHPREATLEQAEPFGTLAEALHDCDFSLGTSGKIRDALAAEPLDIQRAALLFPAPGARLGLVFGNERVGLAAEDAARCDRTLRLPTPGPVESFNLASAVAVTLTLFAEATRGEVAGRAPTGDRAKLLRALVTLAERRGARSLSEGRLAEIVGKMDLSARDITLLLQLLDGPRTPPDP